MTIAADTHPGSDAGTRSHLKCEPSFRTSQFVTVTVEFSICIDAVRRTVREVVVMGKLPVSSVDPPAGLSIIRVLVLRPPD